MTDDEFADETPVFSEPEAETAPEEDAVALNTDVLSDMGFVEDEDMEGEVVIEVSEISLEAPAEPPEDSIARFMESIPSAADDPAEDIRLPHLGDRLVHFSSWAGDGIRAGVEGLRDCGYGNTPAEALNDLKRNSGDPDYV